jgi:hypothetical protein
MSTAFANFDSEHAAPPNPSPLRDADLPLKGGGDL